MNVTGKTEAVRAWLKGCPELGDYLKLNAVELTAGDKAVNTVYNDQEVREFIDGSRERLYTFAVVLVADFSSGFDAVNTTANELGARILDWVDAQHALGNDPDFGQNCSIRKIESVQNVPGLAAAYQEEQLARYMFQAQITYWERT